MSQILDGIRFQEIREAHLNSLMLLKVPEDLVLEYKVELKMESDTMKRELCKDLSSFANSQGGYILFGIGEDNGIPISIDGIQYGDIVRTKLYQVISSGISPRVQMIAEQPVPLGNGNKVVIFKIEPDGNLHQVKYGDNRYYKRVGTITIPMETADVEMFFRRFGQFSGHISRQDKIKQEIDNYYTMLKSKKYFKGLDAKAICTIAIFPEVSSFKLDLSHMPDKSNTLFPPIYSYGWDHEITGNSRFTFGELDKESIPYAVTEVTAFGEVKAYNSSLLDNKYSRLRLPDGASGFIPSIAYEREVINSTHGYVNSLKLLGVNPPFYVDAGILNVKGYFMYIDPERLDRRPRIYQGKDIRPSLVHILNEAAFGSRQALAKEIRPIFDFVWREFGFERSYNYNDEGEWIEER